MKNLSISVVSFAAFAMLTTSSSFSATNPDIEACLKAWGNHPFDKTSPTFRTMKTSVKVMGIGSTIKDTVVTEKPELILVKPSVSVLTKQSLELLNPNGWYCLKGTVTVLGKAEITAQCKTHIASSDDGVNIAASDKDAAGTVSILSKVQLNRVGCEEKKD